MPALIWLLAPLRPKVPCSQRSHYVWNTGHFSFKFSLVSLLLFHILASCLILDPPTVPQILNADIKLWVQSRDITLKWKSTQYLAHVWGKCQTSVHLTAKTSFKNQAAMLEWTTMMLLECKYGMSPSTNETSWLLYCHCFHLPMGGRRKYPVLVSIMTMTSLLHCLDGEGIWWWISGHSWCGQGAVVDKVPIFTML